MTIQLFGVPEAARRLGLTTVRVRQLIEAGRIPATKVGRTWVIREEDLTKYLKKERKPGRPLWGNWYFEDLGEELQRWLVEDCQRMRAQAVEEGGQHEIRVVFYDRKHKPYHYIHDSGYSRTLAEKWRQTCEALNKWAQAVYRARPNVVVERKWDPAKSPGIDLEEIAVVEEGVRVGRPEGGLWVSRAEAEAR
jgi:excisionase family DNA binding protein